MRVSTLNDPGESFRVLNHQSYRKAFTGREGYGSVGSEHFYLWPYMDGLICIMNYWVNIIVIM